MLQKEAKGRKRKRDPNSLPNRRGRRGWRRRAAESDTWGDVSSALHDPEEEGNFCVRGSLLGVANRHGLLWQTLVGSRKYNRTPALWDPNSRVFNRCKSDIPSGSPSLEASITDIPWVSKKFYFLSKLNQWILQNYKIVDDFLGRLFCINLNLKTALTIFMKVSMRGFSGEINRSS